MLDYTSLLKDYTATEEALRARVTDLRRQIKGAALDHHRDQAQKRLVLMQDELNDVLLIRLELARRQREEVTLC